MAATKHYKIQTRDGEFFIFDEARPEVHFQKVNLFGLLKFTAEFARAGHKVSFVDFKDMDERTVCHQIARPIKGTLVHGRGFVPKE